MPVGDSPMTITLTTNALHPSSTMVSHTLPAPPRIDPDSAKYLTIANDRRLSICAAGSSPLLSSFVVSCTVSYTTSSSPVPRHFSAANSEPCSLVGSLCAERACLSSLPSLATDLSQILAVHIVSDSESPLTPGFLCREYMNTAFPLSVMDPAAVDVVLAGVTTAGQIDWSTVKSAPLSSYWPAPSIYTGLRVSSHSFASLSLCLPCSDAGSASTAAVSSLYDSLRALASSPVDLSIYPSDASHKVKYAAGVAFADGTVAVARQIVGLEYGTSLDPVGRLAAGIEAKCGESVSAVSVMIVDNYGGAHAPFGAGRAFLGELGEGTGMKGADVYYHEWVDGEEKREVTMRSIKVEEMCRGLPTFRG